MAITLTPRQEQLVAQAVESGAYQNPDEAIDQALQLLRSQNEWLRENKDAVNSKIERAIGQLERGEGIPGEALPDRLAQRKASWMAEQKS